MADLIPHVDWAEHNIEILCPYDSLMTHLKQAHARVAERDAQIASLKVNFAAALRQARIDALEEAAQHVEANFGYGIRLVIAAEIRTLKVDV